MKRGCIINLALAMAVGTGTANAQELTGTLKNIKETGVITLGHRNYSIPFSYLDDNQKPIGYAMDICYKIVDAVRKELKLDKLEISLNPVTPATRIPLMANGTIDLECGSTTNTVERQKQVWFTNTHFLTASPYVSKKSSKINSIDDLKGRPVVSTAGTTNIKQLTEVSAARNLNINIIPAKDHAEAFLMVETDRAVAFVMDDILLASLVAGSKAPDDYVISKEAFSKPEPYGIMLRKDDTAFKKVVDAATAALYTGGEGQKIYDKWFMQKIPPKGLNLLMPMSKELKNEFANPSDSPDPDSYKVQEELENWAKKQSPTGGTSANATAAAPPTTSAAATAAPPVTAGALIPNLVAPVGRRVALVLGNSSYRHVPSLQNAKNDASDVNNALKSLGFETVLATDLDRSGMNSAVEQFSRLVQGANVALVYYSGHGMQFAGRNYLLPVDANLETSADVNRYRLLPVDDLIEVLGSSNGLQLIVLDACRNNPVEKDFKNKVGSAPGGNRDVAATRGFARMDARSGLIITYATAPNDVAADGTGRNSPFTQAFLKYIAVPDMDIRQVLFRVQSEVYSSSGKQQLPEISSLYVGPEVRLKSSQK